MLAGVSPDDAMSNLGQWASKLGISSIPDWLASRDADYVVVGIGLSLSLLGIITLLFDMYNKFKLSKIEIEQRIAETNLKMEESKRKSNKQEIEMKRVDNEAVRIRIDRLALIELRDLAAANGWDFGASSLHIKDLADGLRQAWIDRTLMAWGRPIRNSFKSLNRDEPLMLISSDYWHDGMVNYSGWASATENFDVMSYNPRVARHQSNTKSINKYADLHIDRVAAIKWLETEAIKVRGRSKPNHRG